MKNVCKRILAVSCIALMLLSMPGVNVLADEIYIDEVLEVAAEPDNVSDISQEVSQDFSEDMNNSSTPADDPLQMPAQEIEDDQPADIDETILFDAAEDISLTEDGIEDSLVGALESTGKSTLDNFINDSRFTNGASWPGDKRPVLYYSDWKGCAAYCMDYVIYCYGIYNPRGGTSFTTTDEIRQGDVLTIGNQHDGTGHWFICLKRNGNSLYVAEGSAGANKNIVRIGWNYTISGNKFAEDPRGFNTGYHFLNAIPPSNPTNFRSDASAYGNASNPQQVPVTLLWNASNNATEYLLDVYCDHEDGSFSQLKAQERISSSQTSYSMTLRDAGTYHTFLWAVNPFGASEKQEYSFRVYASPPTNPTNYRSSMPIYNIPSGSSQVSVSLLWNSSNNVTAYLLDVYCEHEDGSVSQLKAQERISSSQTSYSMIVKDVGTYHTFLWAINPYGASEKQKYSFQVKQSPREMSKCTVTLSPTSYTYSGGAKTPTITVKYDTTTLISGTDYTIAYSNNTNAGTASVTISGKNNYTGTITKTFTIAKATPSLKFASTSLAKKTGDAAFTNALTKTTDGAVTFKSSSTSVATVNSASGKVTIKGAGTATITATAAEGTNYKSGSASYTLKVTASKTDISGCTITLSPTSYTYNGKTKKPTVTVTNGSSTLVTDTDYTVSYSNNTNAGTATATITGKGNYTGTISKTFTINKAAAKLTFANASVSKTTKDAAFTNTLTKTTDGIVTFKSSNTNVATVNSTSGKVTIKGAGTATVTVTASAGTNYKAGSANYTLTVTAPAPAGFSDVQDPSHPYYKAIYWAADAGITKGYPDGTFGIGKACTRSEAVMFLWRLAGKPAPMDALSSPFKDVPKTHAHYKAILWASQKGITKGYSDGTFGINKTCTRGQIMTFIWRFKGQPEPKAVAKSPFSDVPKNHAYYKAILWGAQNKITNGFSDGTFGINKDCTRGQIVTFLYRIK